MSTLLHKQFAVVRAERGLTRKQAAADLGRHPSELYCWEAGRVSPRLSNATAYAGLLGRRLVVTGGKQGVVDLADVARDLRGFREGRGVTAVALAARLHVVYQAVSSLENRTAAGAFSSLAMLERYFAGLDCEIRMIPITQEASC